MSERDFFFVIASAASLIVAGAALWIAFALRRTTRETEKTLIQIQQELAGFRGAGEALRRMSADLREISSAARDLAVPALHGASGVVNMLRKVSGVIAGFKAGAEVYRRCKAREGNGERQSSEKEEVLHG